MDKQDTDDYHYMMEDMTMLPDITILHLNVLAHGHAFGASAFHVLRMCSSIKKLMLSFVPPTLVEVRLSFVFLGSPWLYLLVPLGIRSIFCPEVMAHISRNVYVCIYAYT
jgi:hypothetical protein